MRPTVTASGGKRVDPAIKKLLAVHVPPKSSVVAGLPVNSAPYPTGEDLVIVGLTNEFGSGNIPERSFLRWTMNQHREEYYKAGMSVGKKILKGEMTVEKAFGLIGLKMEGDIVRRISTIQDPPNAPLTIARKGSSKPLIDTGHLKQSIRYQVRIGGKK